MFYNALVNLAKSNLFLDCFYGVQRFVSRKKNLRHFLIAGDQHFILHFTRVRKNVISHKITSFNKIFPPRFFDS